MKFKTPRDFTYEGYLHSAWYAHDETDEQDVYPMFDQFKKLAGAVPGLMPMFFIIDYVQKKYIIFTDGVKCVLGYDARELMEGGIAFTLHIQNKDYFRILNEKVFPATLNILQKIPQREHENYIFSYNNLFRSTEGRYIHLLQKSIYKTAKETGLPLYCIGMAVDINPFKTDNIVIHQAERINTATKTLETIETNFFYPYDEDALLTRQEKNILKYMADGLSSKMIAYKLNISENTIANHRKNMLRKTNTKNVAHLIAFSIKNGMI
jgi:DNA-binding CsgD family transcriptional regulator